LRTSLSTLYLCRCIFPEDPNFTGDIRSLWFTAKKYIKS
jgi:hypothetical protein